MMFRRRNRKHAAVAAGVVARAEQIVSDALMTTLFEAIDQCLEVLNDPRLSPFDAERISAGLDDAFAVLDRISGAA